MDRRELLKIFEDMDDGQEAGEPIAQPIPGLTLHDTFYLRSLIELDLKRNPPE